MSAISWSRALRAPRGLGAFGRARDRPRDSLPVFRGQALVEGKTARFVTTEVGHELIDHRLLGRADPEAHVVDVDLVLHGDHVDDSQGFE